MRILYSTNSFTLPDQPGNGRPFQVAKWLHKQGHDVTVLCNARNIWTDEITYQGTVDAPTVLDGIKIVALPTPAGCRRSKLHRVLHFLILTIQTYLIGRRLPKQDVVIAGTPPLLVPAAALALARKFNALSVLEVRDLHPQASVAAGIVRLPLILWPWRAFEEWLRRSFTEIVAAVPRMRQLIADEGVDPGKITIITNGYDRENDENAVLSKELEAYFDERKNQSIIAYTGNMGRSGWNIHGMVHAAERLKDRTDISFLFIGDGEQRPACTAYVKQHNLTNCTFFGSIPRSQIFTVMRKCTALMAVHHDDPFQDYALPVKLFDYMGAGRPILFSGIGGDSIDLLGKAGGGFILRDFDEAEFADLICKAVSRPDLLEEMGAKNRAYTQAHLMRDHQLKYWETVLPSEPMRATA